MDIEQLVDKGTIRWRRLEALLDRLESAPGHELGVRGLEEIVGLYRQASSDLNRARSMTASPEILDPLNRLVGRGYAFLHGRAPRRRFRVELARHFGQVVPRAFHRRWREVVSATLVLLLGTTVGLVAVLVRPEVAHVLIPEEFFTQSPRERVEQIESSNERIDSLDKALSFGSSLYVHNIKVGCLAFSLAAISLVGGYLLVFQNGVILGAIAAAYSIDGVERFFFAWVGPHGALELPAIVFSTAAGLVLGRALLFPGNLARGARLRESAPDAWRLLSSAALCFLGAGLIEGSFSQFTASLVPQGVKIGVAAILFCCLIAWLTLGGRGVEAEA